MSTDHQNQYFDLAFDFINNTASHVYLTGKAGTGKTTFLRYVKQNCHKNMVVVAPTGVAAINAGGVTMHSFFQLPFGPYVANASRGFGLNDNFVDKNTLLKNLKFGGNKRRLIQELQLLIIDEVSMLRSDMLDAIDTVLRAIRKKNKAFGGVQLLLIGDLYQLPPVVTDNEKYIFDEFYQSPFFFHAKVFEQTQMVFIELKKVYRQTEQVFIDLLNKIRNHNLSAHDYDLLNQRYQPDFKPSDNQYITLTSHNYKADAINTEQLQKLKTPLVEYRGEIQKDFNDKQLPTEMVLKLKVGAQIMFIKNDSSAEKRYYNGKIGIIEKLGPDEIVVKFPDTEETLAIERETWENISYVHNENNNQIEEKILGKFIQFPLRLAWAITIHKSQGLTFKYAIIDAGQSFAAGQVYVALSRCTSLDGIVLLSPIYSNAIKNDNRIFDFNLNEQNLSDIQRQLEADKFHYQIESLRQLFQWNMMESIAYELFETTLQNKSLPAEVAATDFCTSIKEKTKAQKEIADKFCLELESLFNEAAFTQKTQHIESRLKKAIVFFVNKIYTDLIEPLEKFAFALQSVARIKKYFELISDVENRWWQKIDQLQHCRFNELRLFPEPLLFRAPKKISYKTVKKEKGQSAKETLAYFSAGKSIEEIAKLRNLVTSTIESHLAEFIKTGELEITRFMTLENVAEIKEAYDKEEYFNSTDLMHLLGNKYTHAQIRMAVNHLSLHNAVQEKPYKPRMETVSKLPA